MLYVNKGLNHNSLGSNPAHSIVPNTSVGPDPFNRAPLDSRSPLPTVFPDTQLSQDRQLGEIIWTVGECAAATGVQKEMYL